MSKLTLDHRIAAKIKEQMETAARYQNVRPLEQHLALTAMRLFMSRFGYDQVVANLRTHGADVMTKAAQNELKEMASVWTHALAVVPPAPEMETNIRKDIGIVEAGSVSKETNERIYKIMSRLHIREEMIRARRDSPPRMVQ